MSITTLLSLIFATIFIYFLLSLICNAVFEAVSAVFGLRSKYLTQWIRDTFPGAYSHLLNHALLDGVSAKSESASYISSADFVTAFIELIARYWKNKVPADLSEIKTALNDFENNNDYRDAKYILPEEFRRVILVYISEAQTASKDAGEQMKHFRTSLENWFDNMMDRVTGTYKRKSMLSNFIVAIAVTVALNVDSVNIIRYLAGSPTALAGVTAQADKAVLNKEIQQKVADIQKRDSSSSVTTTVTETDTSGGIKKITTTVQSKVAEANDVKNQLNDLIPLGWESEKDGDRNCIWWLSKIFGLLMTIFAVSLGAPFWYNLLLKVADIRSSVKPLSAKAEEDKKKKKK